MKVRLTAKFVTLIALSLLVAFGVCAQGVRRKPKTSAKVASNAVWKTYSICENSVRVSLPSEPVEHVTTENFGEQILTTRTNRARSGNTVFVVTCFEGLPIIAEKMAPEFKQIFFNELMKDYANNVRSLMRAQGFVMDVKLLPVRETTLSGHLGYEQDFTIGVLRGKARMALYGGRGVWSLVVVPDAVTTAGTTFFNSLRIQPNLEQLSGMGKEIM